MRILIIFSIFIFLSSCDDNQTDDRLQGYVEGRQLNLAPRIVGVLTALNVKEGDLVAAGALLFSVDSERDQSRLDEAIAANAAAEAQLLNLQKGGRPEEIRAAQETLNEAEIAFKLATQTFDRSENLVERGFAAAARLDQDQASLDAARARVTEAIARLELIQLPARDDVIGAAMGEVEARKAAISRAMTELKDRSIFAPSAGRIEVIYRRIGEIAGPIQPVLSLLPPDQTRIRIFVPEPLLSSIKHGMRVSVSCDNCEVEMGGEIVFISDQAEFTPPVIFSEKERVKLVYLVEILPDQPQLFLNGQPVSVTLK